MKIWMINQYNMPPEYGHLNRQYNLGKYLKEAGHEPVVFVGSYLHNTDIQMIKGKEKYVTYEGSDFLYYFVRTLNYSGSVIKRVIAMVQFYLNVFKVAKLLDPPDVVIGSSAHPLAALAAIRLGKKYKCQSIVEIRDLWPESFVAYDLISRRNPLLKILYYGEKKMYEKADKVIFTMEGGKDYIIDNRWDVNSGGKINPDNIYHLNNGVDLEVFNKNRDEHTLDDEDLINPDTFKVIYTGSIRLVNNVKRIVDVAEALNNDGSDLMFLIYGTGDQKEMLEEYCREKNINNIRFKGHIDKKYIPFVLTNGNLNIMHVEHSSITKYGASLNKMFDYFASGKPTVSDCEFGYDLINRYKAGISFDNDSSEELAKTILYFRNLSEKEYQEYCDNALRAAKDYDIKVLSERLVSIIQEEIK